MFRQNDEATDRVINDMTLGLVAAFILIIFILILHIGEKSEDKDSKQQGNLVVELYWDDSLETDVDLWVQAPNDSPVGFSNLGGKYFNLLRDDLGNDSNNLDISGKNMEIAVSRGLPEGEYTINAHLFALDGAKLPIDIKVLVSLKKDFDTPTRQLFSVDATLDQVKQEKTLARFNIDENEEFVEGSLYHERKSIRNLMDYSQ